MLLIIPAVINQGKVYWTIISSAFDHERRIGFFEVLVKYDTYKVFLIPDNPEMYCGSVKTRLAEHHEQIEVFHLPGHSPELSPDECSSADLKHVIGRWVPARAKINCEWRSMNICRGWSVNLSVSVSVIRASYMRCQGIREPDQ